MNETQRYALGLEYDGSAYHGWQYQNDSLPTVQKEVESALGKIADQDIKLICAGRTDAGVHASAQVVHFDSSSDRQLKAWTEGVNTLLPNNIAVKWVKPVTSEFHARFSATSREYTYIISNQKTRPGVGSSLITWHRYPLDAELMHEAVQNLLGENDFEAYRGAACQSKSSFRNLMAAEVSRDKHYIVIHLKANAFLLHMVRNIVGVLLEIGERKRQPNWSKEVLDSKDRKLGGVTAKPYGLFLSKVNYPNSFGLPAPEGIKLF